MLLSAQMMKQGVHSMAGVSFKPTVYIQNNVKLNKSSIPQSKYILAKTTKRGILPHFFYSQGYQKNKNKKICAGSCEPYSSTPQELPRYTQYTTNKKTWLSNRTVAYLRDIG